MIMLSGRMGFDGARAATPLLRVSRFAPAQPIYAKLEHLLLTGGIFDRIAAAQVALLREEIEQRGTAVISGSGSTCLAFAAALARVNAKVIAICPKNMLAEHRILLRMHRLQLVLSDAAAGLPGAAELAVHEAEKSSGTLVYTPTAERDAERLFSESTGRDLAAACAQIAAPSVLVVPFISVALIRGTVSALSASGAQLRVLANVSESSASRQDDLYTAAAAPGVEGVETVVVRDADALATRAELARSEGLLLGLSSAAAMRVAAEQSASAVGIAVDAGDRYFSLDREAAAREAAR